MSRTGRYTEAISKLRSFQGPGRADILRCANDIESHVVGLVEICTLLAGLRFKIESIRDHFVPGTSARFIDCPMCRENSQELVDLLDKIEKEG